ARVGHGGGGGRGYVSPQPFLPSGVASLVQSQAPESSLCWQKSLFCWSSGKIDSESFAFWLHVALVPSSGKQTQIRFARSLHGSPHPAAAVRVSMQRSSGKSLTTRKVMEAAIYHGFRLRRRPKGCLVDGCATSGCTGSPARPAPEKDASSAIASPSAASTWRSRISTSRHSAI